MSSKEVQQAIAEIQPAFLIMSRLLVDDIDAVAVSAEPDGEGVLFRLRVAKSDLGKVIGQGGRTARSLRVILHAASVKYKVRIGLDIVDG